MKPRHVRLGLAVFFALMAVLLFLRHELVPDVAAKFRDHRLGLGAWFALALCGWNAARWYVDWAGTRQPTGVNPLSVRTLPRGEDGPNPDLDFNDRK